MPLSKTKLAVFEVGTRTLEALTQAHRLATVLGDAAPVDIIEVIRLAPAQRAAVLNAASDDDALAIALDALAEVTRALARARASDSERRSGLRRVRSR